MVSTQPMTTLKKTKTVTPFTDCEMLSYVLPTLPSAALSTSTNNDCQNAFKQPPEKWCCLC